MSRPMVDGESSDILHATSMACEGMTCLRTRVGGMRIFWNERKFHVLIEKWLNETLNVLAYQGERVKTLVDSTLQLSINLSPVRVLTDANSLA